MYSHIYYVGSFSFLCVNLNSLTVSVFSLNNTFECESVGDDLYQLSLVWKTISLSFLKDIFTRYEFQVKRCFRHLKKFHCLWAPKGNVRSNCLSYSSPQFHCLWVNRLSDKLAVILIFVTLYLVFFSFLWFSDFLFFLLLSSKVGYDVFWVVFLMFLLFEIVGFVVL